MKLVATPLILALLLGPAFANDLPSSGQAKTSSSSGSSAWSTKPSAQKEPIMRARPANPCSQFGAGFIQIEGSSTCVQAGGGLAISAGSGSRR